MFELRRHVPLVSWGEGWILATPVSPPKSKDVQFDELMSSTGLVWGLECPQP